MSYPCGKETEDGTPCERPVERPGGPCGVDHLRAGRFPDLAQSEQAGAATTNSALGSIDEVVGSTEQSTEPKHYSFTVTVRADSFEHARRVMCERVNYHEAYYESPDGEHWSGEPFEGSQSFDYEIDFSGSADDEEPAGEDRFAGLPVIRDDMTPEEAVAAYNLIAEKTQEEWQKIAPLLNRKMDAASAVRALIPDETHFIREENGRFELHRYPPPS